MYEHILSLSGWLLGFYAFRGVKKSPASGQPILASKISVIVPARNESENLRTLLPSLFSAGFDDVIVVDDHSEDNTADMARAHGCRVIRAKPLPEGWTGKNWACVQGAGQAQREWLLFLDADCRMEASAALGDQTPEETVFSYLPYHRVLRPYEQMSSFFNLMMAAGVMTKPAKLFGQCLLISKTTYEQRASHEGVFGKVLENLHMADDLLKAGVRVRSFAGKGLVSMRMFPEGPTQMHQSWLKAFASGAMRVRPIDLIRIVTWISIASYVGYSAVASPSAIGWIYYGLYAVQIHIFQIKLGSYRAWSAIFFIVPLTYFHVVFSIGALRKCLGISGTWRGRHVEG